jgi:SAM-dependent methyltransferase
MTNAAYDESEIRAYWARQAKEHGQAPEASWSDHRVIQLEIAAIGERIAPGARVLDVGCANGYSSVRYLLDREADVTGIDYIPEMIAAAETRRGGLPTGARERIRFAVGDVRSLEFEPASFDSVVSTRVIINLPDTESQAQGLRECARVLRPGGLLLLSEATVQGWSRLNRFREEWGLESIGMPSFNLYLDVDEVVATLTGTCALVAIIDFASSYYVATRVFKPLLARLRDGLVDPNDPNAEFNRWAAQLAAAGDYGTQKLLVFERR